MSNERNVRDRLSRLAPGTVERFDSLVELALDLRWSWNHCADEIWRQLDPGLWEFTQNAWVVLQTVSQDRLQHVLADPDFPRSLMLFWKAG